MPIYEYQCQKCNEVTEVLQRMSDDPLTECNTCDGKLKRLISAPAVQFKGTGWYVTDYAGKKGDDKKASGESKSQGDSTSKSSSGSSSESKSSDSSSSAKSSSSGDKKSA